MNKSLFSPLRLLACGLALGIAPQALACGNGDPFIGSVCFSVTSYCPQGYLEADGRALPIAGNEVLYALLGTTYGGTNTTFNLPDLRGRAPVGQGQGPGLEAAVQGQTRGSETVTLTAQNLPAHTHSAAYTPGSSTTATLNATTNPAASNTPSAQNNQLAVTSNPATRIYAPNGGTQVPLATGGMPVTVQPTGQAEPAPVPVLSGQAVLRACIAEQGIYPSQS